ncbi:hypothetical protein A4S06_05885 [Erysipelotrichaceae bacterium MTC7]|nr:hypothetical protein A4S06_05885 [Erysipelotrichaceae bacterium MTC7]
MDQRTITDYQKEKAALDVKKQEQLQKVEDLVLSQSEYREQAYDYLRLALEDLKAGKPLPKSLKTYISQLKNSGRLDQVSDAEIRQDYEHYRILCMWIAVASLLILQFVKAWLNENYIIGFSFDVIFPIFGAWVLFKNLIGKRKLVLKHKFPKAYYSLDYPVLLFSLALTILIRTPFDISFVLVALVQVFQVHKVKKEFQLIK